MTFYKDCQWGDWKVENCSSSCGGGYKVFRREVIKPATGDGKCEGDATKVEDCNKQTCPSAIASQAILGICLLIAVVAAALYLHKKGYSYLSAPKNFIPLRLELDNPQYSKGRFCLDLEATQVLSKRSQ